MNKLDYIQLAKRFENNHNWNHAAEAWTKAGHTEDANACLFIQESIDRGDRIRMNMLEDK